MSKKGFEIELNYSSEVDQTKDYYQDFIICTNLVLSTLKKTGYFIVSATITSIETIHKLNREFRNMDKPTDVLSFAYLDDTNDVNLDFTDLGDIYICYSISESQAPEYSLTTDQEVIFLFIHGLLHLLGYDHVNDEKEKEIMFSLQKEIFDLYMKKMEV